jgi:hypothetical protein
MSARWKKKLLGDYVAEKQQAQSDASLQQTNSHADNTTQVRLPPFTSTATLFKAAKLPEQGTSAHVSCVKAVMLLFVGTGNQP